MAELYMGSDDFEIWLDPLRARGIDALASSAFAELNSMTAKDLTEKYP